MSEIPERSAEATRRLLRRSVIFEHLEDEELDRIGEVARARHAAAGETLLRQGDPGRQVLFVLTGRVEVEMRSPQGRSVRVNSMGPGEIFGELAVIDGGARSATVTAIEPSELLSIDQAEFLPLLVQHPALTLQILGAVVSRLRRLTEMVSELSAP